MPGKLGVTFLLLCIPKMNSATHGTNDHYVFILDSAYTQNPADISMKSSRLPLYTLNLLLKTKDLELSLRLRKPSNE